MPIFIIIYAHLFVLLLIVIGSLVYLLGYDLATASSGYPDSHNVFPPDRIDVVEFYRAETAPVVQ